MLENDQPVAGDGALALDQIVRQAVAVVVTVPGTRSPGLSVGAASYLAGAGSVVSVAVTNTGNIRLKPIVGFTLLDARGAQVAKATVAMDTFYARTATTIEVQLPAPLAPGDYTVHLTLVDAAQGARADRAGIPFTVAAPPPTAPPARRRLRPHRNDPGGRRGPADAARVGPAPRMRAARGPRRRPGPQRPTAPTDGHLGPLDGRP